MQDRPNFIFGPFCLDSGDERLWRGQEVIRLTRKAFTVLQYLVTHAGQLVTKNELFAMAWPETVVSESALMVCIRELRLALGDQARTPQFIETVYGRGYRFMAPVTVVEPPLVSPQASFVFRPVSLVGREAEWAILQQWFNKALQGERQVGLISGEPGIGKTALVETFAAYVEAEGDIWIGYGQCIDQYGVGEAYLPILEAFGRLCRTNESAGLIDILRQQAPSWLLQMPALISTVEHEDLQRRSRGVTREQMLRELAEVVETLTVDRPLVWIVEDLHWSDVSTLDWLTYVARRRETARLLVLGTYRPVDLEVHAHPLRTVMRELQLHGHCHVLPLPYLQETEIAAYLTQRFGTPPMSGKLANIMHERTSGNPLFMVTLVNELIRQGVLQETVTGWVVRGQIETVSGQIPPTLHHLIEQHIEHLSLADQAILEAASVAGRTFSVATVAAGVEQDEATIEAHCTALSRQGRFVRASGIETWPDGTITACYTFIHALYHEVVYARVSAGQQVSLHQRIGHRKEAAYGAQVTTIAAELARHFECAKDTRRALTYRRHAADHAMQRSAYAEAIDHITQGLILLKALPDTPEHAQHVLAFQLMRGAAVSATQGYAVAEVEQTYSQARELGWQIGETSQLFTALSGLWRVSLVRGDLQASRALGEACLDLAQQTPDAALLVEAHYALGTTLCYLGDLVAAQEQAEQGVALYNIQQHHDLAVHYGGADPGVACHSYGAQVLWLRGYPDQAVQRNQEALDLARELSHPFSVIFALNQTLVLHQLRREKRAAQACAEEVIAYCTEQGFPQMLAMATILRGWAIAERGREHEGIAQMRCGLAANPPGTRLGYPPVLALLAEAYGTVGQFEEGLELLGEALALVRETEERWWEAELYRLKGELLSIAACGLRFAEWPPEACFHQAFDIARHQQAKSLELRAAISLARLWQSQGKRQDAYDLLAPVYNWFTEGFDTADLIDAKALLDELITDKGVSRWPE
jgi:DNA-binding winged helix-turn-helix (wHTH) protein/tetratricopeptide (TPR) repeat protein